MPAAPSPTRLRRDWERFRALPYGRRLFSALFGVSVPYSGTVRPRILELAPGRAVIAMEDRRRVRNHLASIHAIALANLGEMATGLALAYALPPGARTIMKGLHAEYLKKARGTITATAQAPLVDAVERVVPVTAELADASGAVVARVTVDWLVGAHRRPS